MSMVDTMPDSPLRSVCRQLLDLRRLNAELVLPLLAQACGTAGPERLVAHWRAYERPGSYLLGWIDEGEPIALAGLRAMPEAGPGAAELLHLAISPAWRGQGLGRELLAAVQSALALWRIDAASDDDALGFYRRIGWAWAPLPQSCSRPRYGVYWLDARTLLTPGFRFASPRVDPIQLPNMSQARLGMLRLDLVHPLLQGNKWFKLRPHLLQARALGLRRILTFGGAWSNHLLATAAAGKLLGFETIGIVRGELPSPLNPVLSLAAGLGMRLQPMSRADFRALRDKPQSLATEYPEALIVPEGGASALGVAGAAGILDCLPAGTRRLALACGTATTLAGLLRAAPADFDLLGVSVLKGDFLAAEARRWCQAEPLCRWEIDTEHHAGGYARINPALATFLEAFAALNPEISIEPVYTGKLLWALNSRLQFLNSSDLNKPLPLLLHTGGIWPAIDPIPQTPTPNP